MALLSIPVWTIPPDWTSPITEGLEWLTEVMTSQTGVEQRLQLRRSPRRDFDFTVAPVNEWRAYFDNLLSIVPLDLFYLPLWHEIGRVIDFTSLGGSTLRIKGTPAELRSASVIFVQGDRPWKYELSEVTSVSTVGTDTEFTLAAPLTYDWISGSKVFPVAPARLYQMPSYDRLSDRAVNCQIRFDLHTTNDWAGEGEYDVYKSFPVIEIVPNEGEQQNGSYFRYISQIDNNVGLVYSRDIGTLSFSVSNLSSMIVARDASDAMRTMLYALRGRCGQAWLVQPTSDMELVFGTEAGATAATILRCGYADMGGPTTGRQDICVKLRDGTNVYARITSSAVNPGNDEHEIITFETPITDAISLSNVRRISFLSPGRLDQDRVELAHQTDTDGVFTVALAVKTVPDQRTGDDWEPVVLQLTEMGNCDITPPEAVMPMVSFYDGDASRLILISNPDTAGLWTGTNSTMVFSAWVDFAAQGRGFQFGSTHYIPEGHEIGAAGDDGTAWMNIRVDMQPALPDLDNPPEYVAGTGGIFVGCYDPNMITIGVAIFKPPQPGRHHVLISIDSTGNTIQCAIDDVVQDYTWAFGQTWFSATEMGSGDSLDFFALGTGTNVGGDMPGGGPDNSICATSVWISRTSSFWDLTDESIRRGFINANGTRPHMADDGAVNGLQPQIFLNLKVGDAASEFAVNRGSYGDTAIFVNDLLLSVGPGTGSAAKLCNK